MSAERGFGVKRLLRPAGWALSTGIFLAGMALAVSLLYPLNDIVRNWRAFYRLEPRSVDILIVGNSHAYATFDTGQFPGYAGKTACILASNSQNVTQTYFNVLEALRYQTPDTIFLEASAINSNDNFRGGQTDDMDWKKESNIDGMRFGLVKLRAVAAQYRPRNWAYALLPIARCHGNWKDPEQILKNGRFLLEGVESFSAFRPSRSQMSEETMRKYAEAEPRDSRYYISETNLRYFHALAALCRERGITLCLVMAPMYDVYIDSINYASMYGRISALAEQEGVPYLDCNARYDEIGLTAQDFEDAYNTYHHLNAAGAEKVTAFVLEELYGEGNG